MAKEKDFYTKYAYYRKYIEKIGNTPISKPIKAIDLDLSPGVIQMAYKEMKEESFRGNIVDYITWIGGMFMLTLWWERLQARRSEEDWTMRELMANLIDERPVDALVLIRLDLNISYKDFQKIAPLHVEDSMNANDKYHFVALAVVIQATQELRDRDKPENWGKEPTRTNFPNLTKHYLKIQLLSGDSDSSLQSPTNQPLPQTKLKDTSPQTPHTTTLSPSPKTPNTKASSDAKAERSEAFSKGRRTTRPRKRT